MIITILGNVIKAQQKIKSFHTAITVNLKSYDNNLDSHPHQHETMSYYFHYFPEKSLKQEGYGVYSLETTSKHFSKPLLPHQRICIEKAKRDTYLG